jgi:hypothetical protein
MDAVAAEYPSGVVRSSTGSARIRKHGESVDPLTREEGIDRSCSGAEEA